MRSLFFVDIGIRVEVDSLSSAKIVGILLRAKSVRSLSKIKSVNMVSSLGVW